MSSNEQPKGVVGVCVPSPGNKTEDTNRFLSHLLATATYVEHNDIQEDISDLKQKNDQRFQEILKSRGAQHCDILKVIKPSTRESQPLAEANIQPQLPFKPQKIVHKPPEYYIMKKSDPQQALTKMRELEARRNAEEERELYKIRREALQRRREEEEREKEMIKQGREVVERKVGTPKEGYQGQRHGIKQPQNKICSSSNPGHKNLWESKRGADLFVSQEEQESLDLAIQESLKLEEKEKMEEEEELKGYVQTILNEEGQEHLEHRRRDTENSQLAGVSNKPNKTRTYDGNNYEINELKSDHEIEEDNSNSDLAYYKARKPIFRERTEPLMISKEYLSYSRNLNKQKHNDGKYRSSETFKPQFPNPKWKNTNSEKGRSNNFYGQKIQSTSPKRYTKSNDSENGVYDGKQHVSPKNYTKSTDSENGVYDGKQHVSPKRYTKSNNSEKQQHLRRCDNLLVTEKPFNTDSENFRHDISNVPQNKIVDKYKNATPQFMYRLKNPSLARPAPAKSPNDDLNKPNASTAYKKQCINLNVRSRQCEIDDSEEDSVTEESITTSKKQPQDCTKTEYDNKDVQSQLKTTNITQSETLPPGFTCHPRVPPNVIMNPFTAHHLHYQGKSSPQINPALPEIVYPFYEENNNRPKKREIPQYEENKNPLPQKEDIRQTRNNSNIIPTFANPVSNASQGLNFNPAPILLPIRPAMQAPFYNPNNGMVRAHCAHAPHPMRFVGPVIPIPNLPTFINHPTFNTLPPPGFNPSPPGMANIPPFHGIYISHPQVTDANSQINSVTN